MDFARYLNGRQVQASHRRKYELKDGELDRGSKSRLTLGLLLAATFMFLKEALFGQEASAEGEQAASGETARGDNALADEPMELADLAAADAQEPGDQEAVDDESLGEPIPPDALTTRFSSNSSLDAPVATGFTKPAFGPGKTFVSAKNDNTPIAAAIGSSSAVRFDGIGPQAGDAGSAGSGAGGGSTGGRSAAGPENTGAGGNGSGENDPAVDRDDDTDDADKDPRGGPVRNRAPVVSGPVVLDDLLVNQTIVIAMADLLQNAADPDGDALSIRNVAASSGSLVDRGDGTWTFTPAPDDTSEVTFSYEVTDGPAATPQTALLDLLPLPGREFSGSEGPDTIVGTPGSDSIDARAGDDTVYAREGNDAIDGGSGADRLMAGEGNDVVFGGSGDDLIFGGAGDDAIFGGAGNDTIFAGDGNDTIFGEDGQDQIFAGAGDDIVDGGAGADRIEADAGDDVIIGGSGADIADGGTGDDRFIATESDGDDVYYGGSGDDVYDLSGTAAGSVVDLYEGTAESDETGHDRLYDIERVVGSSG
ncbi:MAG: cadherin-like domain-containing protein, partial [Methyloligellaceae bacterium]